VDIKNLISETYPKTRDLLLPLAAVDPIAVRVGCEQNPALLLLLAFETEQPLLWTRADLLADIKARPHDLLEKLGYPGRWLNLLGKLREPCLLDASWLTQYIGQIRRSALARIYRHLAQVSYDVLLLADNFEDFVIDRPGLLRVAAEHPVYEDVCAIRSALHLLGRSTEHLQSRDYDPKWLHAYRSRLEIELIQRGIDPDVIYPQTKKPAPRGWRQIKSLIELHELGSLMENCVASYHGELSAGLAYLFTTTHPAKEPCCCLISMVNGKASVHEIGFTNNRTYSTAEKLYVELLFIEAGLADIA